MLIQLSTASPRLPSPATRKLKAGVKSGVHIISPNGPSPPPASRHRSHVARGSTSVSCSAALARLCTPSARLRSSSGYTSTSTGADSVPHTAPSSRVPSATNSRSAPRLESRSSTPASGYRQAAPVQANPSTNENSAALRCVTSSISAPAILSTVCASSIRIGSSPCTASALPNHRTLFQSGSSARSSTSSTCSGTTTSWCT